MLDAQPEHDQRGGQQHDRVGRVSSGAWAALTGFAVRNGEILVCVLPVLLGDGIRFSSPGLARIDLEPVSSTRSGAVTILRFRVRR